MDRISSFIKNLIALIGLLTLLFAALIKLGDTVKPITDSGAIQLVASWLGVAFDPFFRPRYSSGLGFAYYEVGANGGKTDDGQLAPAPAYTGQLPSYQDLVVGQVLVALSDVNLRLAPNSIGEISQTIKGNECVKIVSKFKELAPAQLRSAKSGGWLQVVKSSCS